jgi:hypothetical protein
MLCRVCVFESKKSEKSRKFWKQKSNFELKKENLTLFSNDSKFDLFVLASMICFVDFSQSEMILFSSKMMKQDFDYENHEFSNWSDDDVEIDEANWLEMSVANFDDNDFSKWRVNRVEMIQKIVFLNWLKDCVEIDEKIRKWIAMNQCDDDEKEKKKKRL